VEVVNRKQPISHKSVILLWTAGGPGHLDTRDPDPNRPWINRGPVGITVNIEDAANLVGSDQCLF